MVQILYQEDEQHHFQIETKDQVSHYYLGIVYYDMHISQIDPLVTNGNKLKSFKDIVVARNKSKFFYGQYIEKFNKSKFKDFQKIN